MEAATLIEFQIKVFGPLIESVASGARSFDEALDAQPELHLRD